MANKILGICKKILIISDDEINELTELAQRQIDYSHPFKSGTVSKRNELGIYNMAVLDKIKELRQMLKDGARLSIKG